MTYFESSNCSQYLFSSSRDLAYSVSWPQNLLREELPLLMTTDPWSPFEKHNPSKHTILLIADPILKVTAFFGNKITAITFCRSYLLNLQEENWIANTLGGRCTSSDSTVHLGRKRWPHPHLWRRYFYRLESGILLVINKADTFRVMKWVLHRNIFVFWNIILWIQLDDHSDMNLITETMSTWSLPGECNLIWLKLTWVLLDKNLS